MGRGAREQVTAAAGGRSFRRDLKERIELKPTSDPPDFESDAYRQRLERVLRSYSAAVLQRSDVSITLTPPDGPPNSYTDMRGNITVYTGFPPNGTPEERDLCVQGLLRHEVAHEAYTNPRVYHTFVKELMSRRDGAQIKYIHNILEDGMIETRLRADNPGGYEFISAFNRLYPRVGQIEAIEEDMVLPFNEDYVPTDADGNSLPVQDGQVIIPAGTRIGSWGKAPVSLTRQMQAALLAEAVPEFEPGELHPKVEACLEECKPFITASITGNTADCVQNAYKVAAIMKKHGLFPEAQEMAGAGDAMGGEGEGGGGDSSSGSGGDGYISVPVTAPVLDDDDDLGEGCAPQNETPDVDGADGPGEELQDAMKGSGASGGTGSDSGAQNDSGQSGGDGNSADRHDGKQGKGADKDGDGKCDNCGSDTNRLGNCDSCGAGKGADKNGDGKCDNCGGQIDKKGKCKSCGSTNGKDPKKKSSRSASQRKADDPGGASDGSARDWSPHQGGDDASGGYDPNRPIPQDLPDKMQREGRGSVSDKRLKDMLDEAKRDLETTRAQERARRQRAIRQGKLDASAFSLPEGQDVVTQRELRTGERALKEETGNLARFGRSLAAQLEQMKVQARAERRFQRHGRFDTRALHRVVAGSRDVMKQEGVKLNFDFEVCVSIDRSGSVQGSGLTADQFRMAKMFAIAGQQARIPTSIMGWDGGSYLCRHFEYKSAHSSDFNSLDSIFQTGGGGTPTAEGVEFARALLRHSKAKKKILAVVTDGEANDIDACREQVRLAEMMGITVIGLGFKGGVNPDSMRAQFGRNWAMIDEFTDAPGIVANLIKRLAWK
jgi:hypothetical protein